ncbi:MAG: formylglycine-generating enzyme family protein [Phycisphaerae bacterium]|nr:formylglycine-generating enzyme family protein [Phycisphaerae bacterium]
MKSMVMSVMMVILVTSHVWAEESQPVKKYTETVKTKRGEELTFDMVLIPGGEFLMGSSANEPGRKDDEGPQHLVKLDSFYLCTKETTLGLFKAYYRETAKAKKNFFGTPAQMKQHEIDAMTRPTPVYGDMTMGHPDECPAIAMSWQNAMIACQWISEKTGKTYRLPTEAEWEYACRAGSSGRFASGDDLTQLQDMAWYLDNSDKEPHDVGTKKPNAWGLYDMMGNVREWVYDFYSPAGYPTQGATTPVLNPTGPKEGELHVARGGDHSSPVEELRSSARAYKEPWWQSLDPQLPKSKWWLPDMDFIGFRVACSVTSEPPK